MFRRLPPRHLLRTTTHRSAIAGPPGGDRTARDPGVERVTAQADTARAGASRITGRAVRYAAAHVAIIALMLSVPAAAFADPSGPVYLAANDLPTVISNLQTWVMGMLAAVATLFLVLAGVYYATAGGDPQQVDKAKGAFKNALIGYGLAVLAPVLLQVVKGIVGG
jgi:hypothetical protein